MSVPQLQARAPVDDGPCTPSCIAMWAAAELGMILVTENGLTRAGPLLSMVAWVVSMLITPPMPLPRIRPTRSGLLLSSSHAPASSSASLLPRSEEHTSELQSRQYLVCRLLL